MSIGNALVENMKIKAGLDDNGLTQLNERNKHLTAMRKG